ncbi:MAG: hypothetical protein JO131_09670 [Gammaproteobacteria bacterium]|nr:hypothetical protein [Gammaproteobacteria bacterium]
MYKYPHLSCGYIGKKHPCATLNSAFYSHILRNKYLLENYLCFPQRIPKVGYFKEIILLEDNSYKKKIYDINNYFLKNLSENIFAIQRSELNKIKILNLLKMMLRYSMFNKIIFLDIPDTLDNLFNLEIKFIKELAKIESNYKEDNSVNLDGLLHLIELSASTASKELRIRLFNRIIVLHYRYQSNIEITLIEQLLSTHIKDVDQYTGNTFNAVILKSLAYRGIAMASNLGTNKQIEYLAKAEYYARKVSYSNEIEKILTIDNLCTYLLTKSKWYSHVKNYNSAKENLLEIISLDPFDSVGYCEMGILLSKQKNFLEAKRYFAKAASLGPPGVGMNTYFQAKCSEYLGIEKDYYKNLLNAALIDKKSLSPMLDLFRYYKSKKIKSRSIKTARNILSSNILCEQLLPEELSELTLALN